MQHTVGKLSTRTTTLLWTSSRSKVCTQNYGPPKLRESQVWKFWNSHLKVPRQNAIWMWASCKGTKYTIRGKMVTSPKSGLWWVLWVQICPWFVLAPKALQLCTNQLVVWFVQVRVSDWSACQSSYSHPETPTCPSTLEVLRAKEHAPTSYYFVVFILDSHLSLLRRLGVRHKVLLHSFIFLLFFNEHRIH